MDCAPFIRTKWVLATWLAVPLLVLIGTGLAVSGFYNQQRASYEQKKSLSQMAPRMREETAYAARFLDTYRVGDAGNGSAQDVYIGLLNNAAEQSGFSIVTISLDQETLDEELGTARIVMSLEGTGTCRQIAELLNQIKQADPLICDNNIKVTPSGKSPESLMVEADFIKIYVE